MSEKTFGFIGCGNMGGAMATAACKSGVGRVLLANRTQAKAEALAARLEGMGAAVAVAENAGVAEEADYIFLGVKPQMMADMLGSIAPVLAARARAGRRFVLVTMAAGLTVARIREMAGADYPVIRIMPNTPCAIGKGMILCAAHGVTEAEKTAFCEGLAAKVGVGAVPGSSFFREPVNHLIRMHFAKNDETLNEALNRLEAMHILKK